ncbi:hypothetical protein GCM10009682_20390 [Luedemannella flava]|uniref:Uncharacterized protein n=1 Tax=Luedemannella flava TaxID=349316 RepID=A0ABN2LT31_9ACTN
MATWNDVVSYVRANYKVSDEGPNKLKLVFETEDLRTQVVVLWHLTLNNTEEWVQIESPFGELGNLNLAHALQQVADKVCGGIGLFGNMVTYRHAVPLDNLNINELERPLALVTTTADRLERELTGGDQF